MTTTLLNIYKGISRETGQLITGTTTGAGSTTTLVDSALADYPDDSEEILEKYTLLESGTYDGQERQNSDFTSSTGTVTFRRALAGAPGTSVTYSIHPWAPAGKMLSKINHAIRRTRHLFQTIRDETTVTRIGKHRYNVPSTIIKDPLQIWICKDELSTILVDDCESSWTAGTNVTASLDSRDYQVGDGSAKFVVAAGASAGAILGYDNFSSLDLSDHIGLRFAIKCSIATSAGDLQIHLSESANGASASETLNVPALTAGKWQLCEVSYAGADSGRNAVISAALYQVTDIGACNIWVDNLESITNNPKVNLGNLERWEQLHYWSYEDDGSKIYFPYELPYNRILRMIGKGYIAASDLSAETDTVAADEPDISHLYALVLSYLYRDEADKSTGGDRAEMAEKADFWRNEAELRGRVLKLDLPRKTVKIPNYTYYGGIA